MLSMLRLLSIILLLNISLFGSTVSDEVVEFLQGKIGKNKSIKNLEINVKKSSPVAGLKGWEQLKIEMIIKGKKTVSKKITIFSDGKVITQGLIRKSKNIDLVSFLKKEFRHNDVEDFNIEIEDKIELKDLKGWYGFILKIYGTDKKSKTKFSQKAILFSNGSFVALDFIDMITEDSLKDSLTPKMKERFYKKEFLVSGNENSKHKVAIFSDPLCPFCKRFVPGALKYMKAHPDKFAVYFYHLPLKQLHPAAPALVKASIYAELKGKKDVVAKLYSLKADYKTPQNKALNEFEKVLGMKFTKKDLNSPEVLKVYKECEKIAVEMMVRGTPTVFLDGQLDSTKKKYEKVK